MHERKGGFIFMKACGLIVEYNPFHYGHLHHLTSSKKLANADCMIAVMSGNFLQRGEPAIMDKFYRTKAALQAGVDIVIELPYSYAVQNSSLFAEGAVKSLHQLGVDSICFGSETGSITPFLQATTYITQHQATYKKALQRFLKQGEAFPVASSKAYDEIGLTELDLHKPNNILGLGYVQAIQHYNYPIEALTTKRIQNDYHDAAITTPIASATSIRQEIEDHGLSPKVLDTVPSTTYDIFASYKQQAGIWHNWECYFPYLQYQVVTNTEKKIKAIQGVDEGLEYRLKQTCLQATSFRHWLHIMKTKRYTQTRLQRMFVHLLTNTTKEDIKEFNSKSTIPYIRLLGFNKTGRTYLRDQKKQMDCPIYSNLNSQNKSDLFLDEKATNTYYLALKPKRRITLRQQEFQLPIMM